MATAPIRIIDYRRPPQQWPRSEPVSGSQTSDPADRSRRSLPRPATIRQSWQSGRSWITGATIGQTVSGDHSRRPAIRTATAATMPDRITGRTDGQTARRPDRQIRKQEQRPRPIQTRPAQDFLSGNFPFYIREFRFFIREFRYSSWRDFLKQPRNGKNFISGNYPGILNETG